MKIIDIEKIPAAVAPKHYDLLGRTIFNAQGTKVTFTRMEKTGRCDPHIHDSLAQLFIVLKGAMLFKSDTGETIVKAGNAVLFEAGEVHSNSNAADGETEYMTVNVTTVT